MKLSTTQEKPATFEELVAVWGLLLTEAFVLFKLAPGDGVRLHWSREVVRSGKPAMRRRTRSSRARRGSRSAKRSW
jgi:hypothetical protein